MSEQLSDINEAYFGPKIVFLDDALPEVPPESLPPEIHLPIEKHRAEIETAILENPVTILVAPTGSGKTTKVPPFTRKLMMGNKPFFDEIIVTQPRIVAARTVSERVAEEIALAEDTHDVVGYYTSKEGTVEPQRDQDIAFLTDGKAAAQLLHKMGKEDSRKRRLLVIDEVHEWNLHIEMLIAIAAKKTDPSSPQYDPTLKVVIMSATMDGERIQEHFRHCKPPLITVQVPTHEVVRSVSSKSVAEVALQFATDSGNKVLAFHAGKREIAATAQTIAARQEHIEKYKHIPVIPLHGQLSADEQRLAFDDYDTGSVIATTNAAETSLTVPGAIAVVDGGDVRTDRLRYDLVPTGSEGLYLEPASQANLNQRAGRVGRTGPGDYVLCTQKGGELPLPFASRPEYGTPAMHRTSLDGMVLHLKASGYNASDFRFFHEPPKRALEAATQRLTVLGALDKNGNVTQRGLQMERLPLDPEYSCMIVFAYEKGYSDEVKKHVIDIAALMQRGGILKRAPQEQRWRELIESDIEGDPKEQDSDFFVQLEVYAEIMNYVKREHWENYDIIEHSADLVEQGRESLARALDIELSSVTTVEAKNRHTVLTCIHAGQLNQLWQRRGEQWSLAVGTSLEYELASSSVVRNVGRLVTGNLFSLGNPGITYHAIQNVNRVIDDATLEQSAAHLISDVESDAPAYYDPEKQALVIRMDRTLGSLVLRSYTKTVDVAHDSPEIDVVRKGHSDYAWSLWLSKKDKPVAYTSDTIDAAIKEPKQIQYGEDPITGEPLLAWIGGKGTAVRSKEAALHSLLSFKAQLDKKPKKDELNAIKADVRSMRAKLTALKKGSKTNPAITEARVREVLLAMNNSREWLDEASSLFIAD